MIYPSYVTSKGLSDLKQELEDLKLTRRPATAGRIQTAKQIGGTVDNAEYEEAKNEQAFIEGRILTLETNLKNAVLIPAQMASSGKVEVGSLVTLVNPNGQKHKYAIVGSTEADPSKGKISNESPVGKAILGRKVGDEAEVSTPSGTVKFNIVKIQ